MFEAGITVGSAPPLVGVRCKHIEMPWMALWETRVPSQFSGHVYPAENAQYPGCRAEPRGSCFVWGGHFLGPRSFLWKRVSWSEFLLPGRPVSSARPGLARCSVHPGSRRVFDLQLNRRVCFRSEQFDAPSPPEPNPFHSQSRLCPVGGTRAP